MRTIKFRGYDAVGNKGWVYGDLVHNQKVTTTGLEPRVMVGGYEVIPETVGQFTGLQDDNGKDMYEGDVIHVYSRRFNGNCYIGIYNAQFALFTAENNLLGYFRGSAPHRLVIGNVHENPELISRDK